MQTIDDGNGTLETEAGNSFTLRLQGHIEAVDVQTAQGARELAAALADWADERDPKPVRIAIRINEDLLRRFVEEAKSLREVADELATEYPEGTGLGEAYRYPIKRFDEAFAALQSVLGD